MCIEDFKLSGLMYSKTLATVYTFVHLLRTGGAHHCFRMVVNSASQIHTMCSEDLILSSGSTVPCKISESIEDLKWVYYRMDLTSCEKVIKLAFYHCFATR